MVSLVSSNANSPSEISKSSAVIAGNSFPYILVNLVFLKVMVISLGRTVGTTSVNIVSYFLSYGIKPILHLESVPTSNSSSLLASILIAHLPSIISPL